MRPGCCGVSVMFRSWIRCLVNFQHRLNELRCLLRFASAGVIKRDDDSFALASDALELAGDQNMLHREPVRQHLSDGRAEEKIVRESDRSLVLHLKRLEDRADRLGAHVTFHGLDSLAGERTTRIVVSNRVISHVQAN